LSITRRHIKAFFIALLSFKFPVSWGRGRRKRCKFAGFKSFKHPLLLKFLGLFFDVRRSINGDVEIWFRERERDAVNKRRMLRRLKHILSQNRGHV
jgi:hypothetical protein